MPKLNSAHLSQIAQTVPVPSYDPQSLTTGIVHIGVGAFHRSHQAMYLDRLLNTGQGGEWAICGVGLLPSDTHMRDVLADQDYLYTLVSKPPVGQSEARVIGAISEYLFAPENPEAVLEKLADPGTRIVSLTVTEGGYSLNDATGEFDPTTPGVAHDLQAGAVPQTVFGYLTEGLRRRRERGIPPFTVMSCDNIQGNGQVAQKVVSAFARLKDPALGEWIASQVAFPNSMVDRITPGTTDEMKRELEREFGIEDGWPVIAESFVQWVLEDHFTLGRPALETVGVQIVQDVEPYELMKLRLLNASHQAMAYPGLLAGYTYVHEACHDPAISDFLLAYMEREGTPTLRPVPGIDLTDYRRELITRFSSVAIQDTLARLAFDGADRLPKFLLPVVREQLETGGEIKHSAMVIAAYSLYLEAAGAGRFKLQEQRAASLLDAVSREAQTPGALLDLTVVFGEVGQNERFRQAYLDARANLRQHGPVEALKQL
jgi:mannitol 2-dehydrogenase